MIKLSEMIKLRKWELIKSDPSEGFDENKLMVKTIINYIDNYFSPPKLEFKKLYPDAKIPTRNFPSDAGADCYIHRFVKYFDNQTDNEYSLINKDYINLLPNERVVCGLGFAAKVSGKLDEQFVIKAYSRSGQGQKQGITLSNSVGVVDQNYRGECFATIVNLSNKPQTINVDDKICQLVVHKIQIPEILEVESLDDTDRGEKGFGSSGV